MEEELNKKLLKILNLNIECCEKNQSYNFISAGTFICVFCTLCMSLIAPIYTRDIVINISTLVLYFAIFYNIIYSVFRVINIIFRSKSMINLHFGNYDKFTKRSHLIAHSWELLFSILGIITNAFVVSNNLNLYGINLNVVVFSIFLYEMLRVTSGKFKLIKRDYISPSNNGISYSDKIKEVRESFEIYIKHIIISGFFIATIFISTFIYVGINNYNINNLRSIQIAAVLNSIYLIVNLITMRLADKMKLNWLNKIKKDVELGKNISNEIQHIILHEEFNNFNTNLFPCDD